MRKTSDDKTDTFVKTYEKHIIELVKESVDDVVSDYEVLSDGIKVMLSKDMGRGFRFGSGTNGGCMVRVMVPLSYMESTGRKPGSSEVKAIIDKGSDSAYAFAAKEWAEQNKEIMEENGLTVDDVSYSALEDLGLTSEAEEFDEFFRESMNDEYVDLKVGIFYFDVGNSNSPDKTKSYFEVFSNIEVDGRFLGDKSVEVYSKFFPATRSWKKDVEKHLKEAASKI